MSRPSLVASPTEENRKLIVTIEGPKSDNMDARRKLVDAVTEAASEYYGMPRETIITLIKETPPDRVAVGGTLIVDRVGRPREE